jgi:hypothetical protein
VGAVCVSKATCNESDWRIEPSDDPESGVPAGERGVTFVGSFADIE